MGVLCKNKKKGILAMDKRTLMLFMGIKIAVIGLCVSFFGVRYVIGQIWFDKTADNRDVIYELHKSDNKPLIDSYDASGKTGLMLAASYGNFELVQEFVKVGANVRLHAQDDSEDTALHIACYNGDFTQGTAIIEFLLNAGADPSSRNKRGETPLHHCMQIDNLDARRAIMTLMVKRGADINGQDRNGTTVLHLAVNNKEDYGVEMLLSTFGPTIDFSLTNNKGKTALEYARFLGFTDVARRIEQYLSTLQRTKPGTDSD